MRKETPHTQKNGVYHAWHECRKLLANVNGAILLDCRTAAAAAAVSDHRRLVFVYACMYATHTRDKRQHQSERWSFDVATLCHVLCFHLIKETPSLRLLGACMLSCGSSSRFSDCYARLVCPCTSLN